MEGFEKLNSFHDKLKKAHEEHFPDMEFMQFVTAFSEWGLKTHGFDPLYVEEDKMLELIREYAENHSA